MGSSSTNNYIYSSSLIGEYIGVESCLDLIPVDENYDHNLMCSIGHEREQQQQPWEMMRRIMTMSKKKKEFPPPIPLLARTENLPSHMPWVLKRYYTSDGRLILTEEKVRHHEYFRAHRSNGRLTLQLVPLEDDIIAQEDEDDQVEEEEEVGRESSVVSSNNICVRDQDQRGFVGFQEEQPPQQRLPSSMETSSPGKCLNNYNSLSRRSSCIFGVPLPAMRPIQS